MIIRLVSRDTVEFCTTLPDTCSDAYGLSPLLLMLFYSPLTGVRFILTSVVC